jgi:cytochrome P450
VIFDPTSPAMRDDPYPVYRELRDRDPVHYSEKFSTWVLSRYDDVRNALLDPQTYCSGRGVLLGSDPADFLPMVETTDPPEHTPLRALIGEAFRRRNVGPMEESLQGLVTQLIDGFIERGECDLSAELAWPFPANVICELLGVPDEDREQFRDWAYALSTTHDGEPNAAKSIYAYFADILEARRARPRGDLISTLLQARIDGQALTQTQLLGTCFQLVIAGHETTTNLLGNTFVLLCRDRDLRRRLIEQRDLVPSALEEILRFEPPVQGLSRTLTRDVELHGRKMKAGDRVHCLFAAANRDERAFDSPDRLDPTRSPNPHLSFGFGIHFCAGAHLARLEARIAVSAALERLPDFEMIDERVERFPSLMLRGVQRLPVTFEPGPRRG